MKKACTFLFITIIIISCTATRKSINTIRFADNPVVAHRGAFKKNGFPENSIASLKHAISLRCTGSEFDVRMTADDSLIINHDPTHHGMDIEKTNYDVLAKTKLSNGETIPTLREYIQAGMENNTHTRLVCEIKPSPAGKERGEKIALHVLALIRELKAGALTVYISFDYNMLTTLLKADPTLSTQYLNGDKSPDQLKVDGINGLDYHFSVFKAHPEWIESAKKNGIALNAWTVNDGEEMDRLLKSGFDFITTNEPELLLEKVKK